jgi:hypothetical protein
MDPKTDAEMMEDTRPEGRGFVDDAQTDAEALQDIESHDDESQDEEG